MLTEWNNITITKLIIFMLKEFMDTIIIQQSSEIKFVKYWLLLSDLCFLNKSSRIITKSVFKHPKRALTIALSLFQAFLTSTAFSAYKQLHHQLQLYRFVFICIQVLYLYYFSTSTELELLSDRNVAF